MADHVVKTLVVDSGGFLKDAPLGSIGESIYTLQDVVDEIRDKATKQRLQVLPYELKYREPSVEAVKFVSEFAKKTGDYPSLSVTDIRVLALTYMLEKECVGGEHIKTIPERKAVWSETRKTLEKPTDVAGFYLGPKEVGQRSRNTTDCSHPEESVEETEEMEAQEATEDTNEHEPTCDSLENTEKCDNPVERTESKIVEKQDDLDLSGNLDLHSDENCGPEKLDVSEREKGELVLDSVEMKESLEGNEKQGLDDVENVDSKSETEESASGDVSGDSGLDDSDDAGWITPQNIANVKKSMRNMNEEEKKVVVGCLTTDFAMQNVLLQMGLNVISVDGMLIKRTKSYVMRCYACNKITSEMTRQFCPNCGNNTLRKVSMTVNSDGSIQYFLSKRKAPTTRGMNQSLPAPRGGKHASNPILFADQPIPQQKPSKKALARTNVFAPDYDAGASPFAVNDVTSRAAQLGIKHGKKRQGKRQ